MKTRDNSDTGRHLDKTWLTILEYAPFRFTVYKRLFFHSDVRRKLKPLTPPVAQGSDSIFSERSGRVCIRSGTNPVNHAEE